MGNGACASTRPRRWPGVEGRAIFHAALHVLLPLLVAALAFRPIWRRAALVMLATLVVDADHLLADPIYDPQRCSIGFHPLHGLLPILFYVFLCFVPALRLVGLGLVLHMLLDAVDCLTMPGGARQLQDFLRLP